METKNFLQEKAVETTKQKEEKRKKHKTEEQKGMPQHQHCPPAKHRDIHGNPAYAIYRARRVQYNTNRILR
jgi:hypothetical protein